MKKMMKMMVLVLAMLCVVPSMALAQGGWVTANITSIGLGGAQTLIALVDTATPPNFPGGTYFVADNTGVASKQMLATALTAVSLSKTVVVYLDNYAAISNMSAMYLNQ